MLVFTLKSRIFESLLFLDFKNRILLDISNLLLYDFKGRPFADFIVVKNLSKSGIKSQLKVEFWNDNLRVKVVLTPWSK